MTFGGEEWGLNSRLVSDPMITSTWLRVDCYVPNEWSCESLYNVGH